MAENQGDGDDNENKQSYVNFVIAVESLEIAITGKATHSIQYLNLALEP